MGEPCGVRADVGGPVLGDDASDAEAYDLEAEVFVVVTSGSFAEDFADAVVAVGSDGDVVIDLGDVFGVVVDEGVVAFSDAFVWFVEFEVSDGVV